MGIGIGLGLFFMLLVGYLTVAMCIVDAALQNNSVFSIGRGVFFTIDNGMIISRNIFSHLVS